jgi:hypothetical protein
MVAKSVAKKSLEEKVQYLLDYIEVETLMHTYGYKLDHFQFDDIVELFAKKTPGVRVEMMWGVYEGIEGVRRLYSGYHNWSCGKPPKPGYWSTLMDVNTIIEVAGDGKTAKAVSECVGHETFPVEGKMQAFWCNAKRGFDFVKEDGKWKIWHYHVYGGYYTPFEKSWVEEAEHPEYTGPDEFKADRPPTTHWMYTQKAVLQEVPLLPKPYETFDEKTAY